MTLKMNEDEIRKDERQKTLQEVQKWLDENNVYQVTRGHYNYDPPHEYGKWVIDQHTRISILEVLGEQKTKGETVDTKVTKQSTVIAKGERIKVNAGEPFVQTIVEVAERLRISQFTVKMTDKDGNTFEIDLCRPPDVVPVGHTIHIYPYDRAG